MVWSMPVDPQHNLAVALRRAEPAAASHILRTAQLRRREYLAALEKTSVQGEISDFTKFVVEELNVPAKFRLVRPVRGSARRPRVP